MRVIPDRFRNKNIPEHCAIAIIYPIGQNPKVASVAKAELHENKKWVYVTCKDEKYEIRSTSKFEHSCLAMIFGDGPAYSEKSEFQSLEHIVVYANTKKNAELAMITLEAEQGFTRTPAKKKKKTTRKNTDSDVESTDNSPEENKDAIPTSGVDGSVEGIDTAEVTGE